MLPFILFAMLTTTPQVSMECANTASAQTQPVRGPAGSSATLKISSSDDDSKDSHQCSADYQLLVTPSAGAAPVTVDFLSSYGDYGRTLSVRLDGFSQDGRRIVGVLAEGGSSPITLLFDYHTSGGPAQLVDLGKQFVPLMTVACTRTLDVIGTTSSGVLVLGANSAGSCTSSSRWLLAPSRGRPRPFRQSDTLQSLYSGR